jgi:hypothetical protein
VCTDPGEEGKRGVVKPRHIYVFDTIDAILGQFINKIKYYLKKTWFPEVPLRIIIDLFNDTLNPPVIIYQAANQGHS